MKLNNYYVSSFFWSTLCKVINAIAGFISIPILLKYYGVDQYGILSLAIAANAYISLLDLGINTGAIKFFSQWKAEGNHKIIDAVARTNITFYLIIGLVNILFLLLVILFGQDIYNIPINQFSILQKYLTIIAIFSTFNWISSSFNQLLVADKEMVFVQQMQTISALARVSIICLTIIFKFSLITYFILWNISTALLILPYAKKCIDKKLISSLLPQWDWPSFKTVIVYSLNIFALSIFQMTATNSRPIILGILSVNASQIAAEYRIVEVIPSFIISVGGIISSILLPRSSELIAKNDKLGKENIAYTGTKITTILANFLCIPFILNASDILSAYVGKSFDHLSIWLIIWCITILIQIHTTPCNSLILATGKTKFLVYTSAISCLISIIINSILCKFLGIGSAVIGYSVYVIIVIGLNYLFFYPKILKLSFKKLIISFILPTIYSFLALFIILLIPFEIIPFWNRQERIFFLLKFMIRTSLWSIIYLSFLYIFRIYNKNHLHSATLNSQSINS